jgi:aminopeptidase N
MIACHPKTGSKTARTPAKPDEPEKFVDPKPEMGTPEEEGDVLEYNMMDAVDIMPEKAINPDTLAPYNPSATHQHDLLHTKIEISFDWDKKRANGKATLRLKPWFYATDHLVLDAKNFDIKSVALANGTALKYDYNNEQLDIALDKKYTRKDEFEVVITYTAKPDERESYGGSAAITQDKGLYFINADGKENGKPRQIWTQGETESNSFWFPTVDKPNERCTQEMYITVENKYKTLSNGLLVSSKNNPDGTRTDYWKNDMPHAPYLFMMAVGEFAVVSDKWRGKDVNYYVEPAFEQYARDIYPYTTEMLEFFSNKLDYPFPWQKYSQVIVRDYVSGAMENTSAVIFGEYMQNTKRALLDNGRTNEKVVAHEMFHHWFGDLVTTESWANLTMNEGFANYSEYLWLEHKHGADVADEHLRTEQQGYMFSASDGGHPLIHFGYGSREDMFDAHSYNKGGSVLHMLRNYVGDEAFFASLNLYLKRNQFTDVESHELRLAFEDVTGQDLSWFFNQWYLAAGHPSLDIAYNWDETAKTTTVTIEQQQLAENKVPYIFQLPLAVDVYDAGGKARREQIMVTKRKQTFTFKSDSKPAVVNVDADKALLCVKTDQHSMDEWKALFKFGPKFRDRIEALQAFAADENKPMDLLQMALSDKSAEIRDFALNSIDPSTNNITAKLVEMIEKEPEPGVRATAIMSLSSLQDKQYIPLFQKCITADAPYSVVGAAMSAITSLDPTAALTAAKSLENDENPEIIASLAQVYAENPTPEQLEWFKKRAPKVDQMAAFTFFENYQKYLVALNNPAALDAGIAEWKNNALTPVGNSEWRRFASTKALADTRNHLRDSGGDSAKADAIDAMINEIKEKETDPTLKMYYGLF